MNKLIAGLVSAASLMGLANAQFSTNFTVSEGYDNTGNPPLSGTNGWTTNDPLVGTPPFQSGESNFISFIPGVTPGTAVTNSSGVIGGLAIADDFFPANPASNIALEFGAVPTTIANPYVRMQSQFVLVGSTNPSYPNEDVFSYQFRTAGGTNLLTEISFTTTPSFGPPLLGDWRIEWSLNGNVQSISNPALVAYFDGFYDQKYVLQADFGDSTFSLQVLTLDNTTLAVTDTASIIVGGAINTGYGKDDLENLAVVWDLSNTTQDDPSFPEAYNNAGSNYIALNTLSAQAIPEPSTYALLALGAAGMVAFRRFRKKA